MRRERKVDEGFLNHTRKDLIAFGMVAAISQKGENRHFSATITPENTAWEPLQSRNCQGQNAKRKSVSAGRCSFPYRSFPPVTPSRRPDCLSGPWAREARDYSGLGVGFTFAIFPVLYPVLSPERVPGRLYPLSFLLGSGEGAGAGRARRDVPGSPLRFLSGLLERRPVGDGDRGQAPPGVPDRRISPPPTST